MNEFVPGPGTNERMNEFRYSFLGSRNEMNEFRSMRSFVPGPERSERIRSFDSFLNERNEGINSFIRAWPRTK